MNVGIHVIVNSRMLLLGLFIFQINSEGRINEDCALNIIAHEVGKKNCCLVTYKPLTLCNDTQSG